MNTLFSFETLPIITKRARVTDSTKTIIDCVISNDTANNVVPGVETDELSDQYPFFISKKLISKKLNECIRHCRAKSRCISDAYSDDLKIRFALISHFSLK